MHSPVGASTSSGSTTTCARTSSAPTRPPRWNRCASGSSASWRGYRHVDLDIRDRAGVARLFTQLGADIALVVHCAAQPSHDWAATRAVHRLRRQRRRHAEPARGDAPARAGRDVHLHVDEQGLRRRAERAAAASSWRRGGRSTPATATHDGIREDMSIDGSLHSGVRRVEGRGRRAGAGVRPLLRPARRRASAAGRSPARSTPRPSCTASSPT